MKKMRTKPLFGRGKLQKMLLVTRIGLLCILAFNITAAANVFSQAFNLKEECYFGRSATGNSEKKFFRYHLQQRTNQ